MTHAQSDSTDERDPDKNEDWPLPEGCTGTWHPPQRTCIHCGGTPTRASYGWAIERYLPFTPQVARLTEEGDAWGTLSTEFPGLIDLIRARNAADRKRHP